MTVQALQTSHYLSPLPSCHKRHPSARASFWSPSSVGIQSLAAFVRGCCVAMWLLWKQLTLDCQGMWWCIWEDYASKPDLSSLPGLEAVNLKKLLNSIANNSFWKLCGTDIINWRALNCIIMVLFSNYDTIAGEGTGHGEKDFCTNFSHD